MKEIFGRIDVGAHCICPKMELSEAGRIAEEEIIKTSEIRENIEINEYVIMPNHIHFIIEIKNEGHVQRAHTEKNKKIEEFGKSTSNTIPTIVRLIKSSVTKRINDIENNNDTPIWHRNYYENIIRNEEAYLKVSRYIRENPTRWVEDRYYDFNENSN